MGGVGGGGGWWGVGGGGGVGGDGGGVLGLVVTRFAIPEPAPNPKIKSKGRRGGGW